MTVSHLVVSETKPIGSGRRIQLPLVPPNRPGTVRLTNGSIAKVLYDVVVAAAAHVGSPLPSQGSRALDNQA